MRFPPSFLERLRAQLTLSDVIGKRIPIKKHGREFQGLCPFHNEKTPSFTVNDDKGFFHCFGCAAHGDAIGFVMRYERLTYPEAVERLARDVGLPLPELTREDAIRAEREKTQLSIAEAACRWFERQLTQHMLARQYIEKRGLAADTVRRFRIGYAPDERQALLQFLTQNGYSEAQAVEAGLVIKTDDGKTYDRFRGRLMFPIRSARGDVIAFGGRLIVEAEGRSLAKYLNSPETPLFHKGEMLFNLDLAKSAIREREVTVVMEGYMDVVSVAQSGVDYAVATLGTAVTPEHLKLLWRLTKEPVMCLDGDAAGKRAMARAAEIALPLLTPGCSLKFAILPKGEDPDSYIQKFGKASFEEIVRQATPLYKQVWETLLESHAANLGKPEGRAALEAACHQAAEKIQHPVVRKHYADLLGKQVWEHVRKSPRGATLIRSAEVAQLAAQDDPHSANKDALVAQMLRLLLQFPPLLHKSSVEESLSQLEIRDRRFAAVRDAMIASIEHAGLEERETLLAYLKERLPEDALAIILAKAPPSASSTEEASHFWKFAMASHQIEELKSELLLLQQGELDEIKLARLMEVQAALKKAQHAQNFAPLNADTA